MDVIAYALAKGKAKNYTDDKFSGISGGFNYQGSVATISDLPAASAENKGYEYTVGDLGTYVSDGTNWVPAGIKGSGGESAGFGTPTATVDANTGTPSVEITSSGPDTAKIFNFAFHNLKGEGSNVDVDNKSIIKNQSNQLETTFDGYLETATGGIDLAWTGDPTGYTTIDVDLGSMRFIWAKLSNNTVTLSDITSSSLTAINPGTGESTVSLMDPEYSSNIFEVSDLVGATGEGYVFGEAMAIVFANSAEVVVSPYGDPLTFTQGIWFLKIVSSSSTYMLTKALTSGTQYYHKCNPAFLPIDDYTIKISEDDQLYVANSGGTVSVSASGTSTDVVNYITIDGTEKKLVGDIPEVINAVNNTSTTDALSANMGKELQDQVNNLKNIGRFLAIWDSSTGLPLTNPTTMPYTYKTGDYYRVGTVSTATPAVNYKPNGATYGGTASTTLETESVEVGWVYYYDGSQWLAQSAGGGGTVQDVQINGTTIVASGTGVANITDATLADVKYTSQSLTDVQKAQARTNIGAIALEAYDSSATPVDGVLYYVDEA